MTPWSQDEKLQNLLAFACYLLQIEPKSVKDALLDEFLLAAMQDEMGNFKRLGVWIMVPRPDGANVIGTKWLFKNKSDEFRTVTRNKARLVAQGYSQVEGIDFDETFAPVARLESIRLLLIIACFMKMKLFQMDVKSATVDYELLLVRRQS
jgi:hypothetical protein